MKPITFPTLPDLAGAIHVRPHGLGPGIAAEASCGVIAGPYEAWLDVAPGEDCTGLIIGTGGTEREALEAAYQFLTAAAAAVLVRR